jgi:hypothetical protein
VPYDGMIIGDKVEHIESYFPSNSVVAITRFIHVKLILYFLSECMMSLNNQKVGKKNVCRMTV